jgi:tRNA-dihydrouridine synthase
MIEETGVALVSVARGCIGNPWIFRQARALLAGDREAATRTPTLAEQRAVLLEHFDLAVARHGEHKAGMTMRKFGIKFARHHARAEEVAQAFIRVASLADLRAVLADHYAPAGDVDCAA